MATRSFKLVIVQDDSAKDIRVTLTRKYCPCQPCHVSTYSREEHLHEAKTSRKIVYKKELSGETAKSDGGAASYPRTNWTDREDLFGEEDPPQVRQTMLTELKSESVS